MPPERIEVSPDLAEGLDLSEQRDGGRPLYVLPTYTALIELQDLLASRGLRDPTGG